MADKSHQAPAGPDLALLGGEPADHGLGRLNPARSTAAYRSAVFSRAADHDASVPAASGDDARPSPPPTTPARAGAAKRRPQMSQARSVLGTDESVADGSRAA